MPVKNTVLDSRLGHSNKDKSSTIKTETLSAEIHTEVFEFTTQNLKHADFSDLAKEWPTVTPDTSKRFIQTEGLKNNVQSSQVETDWSKNSQGMKSGIKEMMNSENELEEEIFSVKSPQMLTKNKGELKGKKKQNFDEDRSDLNKRPESNEDSSTNAPNDDGDGDVTP